MIGLQHEFVTGPGRMAVSNIPLALALISGKTEQKVQFPLCLFVLSTLLLLR